MCKILFCNINKSRVTTYIHVREESWGFVAKNRERLKPTDCQLTSFVRREFQFQVKSHWQRGPGKLDSPGNP